MLLERKANLEAKDNMGTCLARSGGHNKHNTESRKPAEHTAACDHEFISILLALSLFRRRVWGFIMFVAACFCLALSALDHEDILQAFVCFRCAFVDVASWFLVVIVFSYLNAHESWES